MQVHQIQKYNTNFAANLKVINKYYDKNFMAQLAEKADNIGLQGDTIELKFTDFQDKKENVFFGRKNVINNGIKRISEIFHGRFIPLGEDYGVDYYEKILTADTYKDIWNQEESVAEKYLYILGKKYTT